jgi:hypothetical protein
MNSFSEKSDDRKWDFRGISSFENSNSNGANINSSTQNSSNVLKTENVLLWTKYVNNKWEKDWNSTYYEKISTNLGVNKSFFLNQKNPMLMPSNLFSYTVYYINTREPKHPYKITSCQFQPLKLSIIKIYETLIRLENTLPNNRINKRIFEIETTESCEEYTLQRIVIKQDNQSNGTSDSNSNSVFTCCVDADIKNEQLLDMVQMK